MTEAAFTEVSSRHICEKSPHKLQGIPADRVSETNPSRSCESIDRYPKMATAIREPLIFLVLGMP
jgi:hypothetical protein